MIDWQRVAELRDEIGATDFDEVVELFLTEVERALDGLPEASDDARALEEQMHFLKGSALNLGFSALAMICGAGEQAAASGDTGAIDVDAVNKTYTDSKALFLSELPKRVAA